MDSLRGYSFFKQLVEFYVCLKENLDHKNEISHSNFLGNWDKYYWLFYMEIIAIMFYISFLKRIFLYYLHMNLFWKMWKEEKYLGKYLLAMRGKCHAMRTKHQGFIERGYYYSIAHNFKYCLLTINH